MTVYELEKFRCGLCGEVFTAKLPEGAGLDKYDPSVAGMIAVLKYGNGLQVIYHNDQLAREQHLTAEERLQFHQQDSGPTMARLREWLKRHSEQKLVEPNSGLGTAINYLRKHWEKLTLFLRVAGAPLDNNICERALKKAILHRRNALFFKTKHGAAVGDFCLSLIHTRELSGGNPFEYPAALQRHAAAVTAAPGEWMPWNYRDRLACLAAG